MWLLCLLLVVNKWYEGTECNMFGDASGAGPQGAASGIFGSQALGLQYTTPRPRDSTAADPVVAGFMRESERLVQGQGGSLSIMCSVFTGCILQASISKHSVRQRSCNLGSVSSGSPLSAETIILQLV